MAKSTKLNILVDLAARAEFDGKAMPDGGRNRCRTTTRMLQSSINLHLRPEVVVRTNFHQMADVSI